MTIPFHQQLVALPSLDAERGEHRDDAGVSPGLGEDPACAGAHEGDHPDTPRPGPPHLLTPQRQADFARSLAEHGNVRLACRAVGVSPQTAYRARRHGRAFRRVWDTAMAIAREAVEQVLADRAINGVEEKVFYHGEEVATRTRYDSRLLLAHLARLDRKVEEGASCDECGVLLLEEEEFDVALMALEDEAEFAPGLCAMCSTIAADDARRREESACPDCGGRCDEWRADPAVELEQADCMWLGNRLDRMDKARPRGEPLPHALPGGDPEGDVEMAQLAAFEAGEAHWWELALADLEPEDPAADGGVGTA